VCRGISIRTAPAQAAGPCRLPENPQPHPHPLARVFQMTDLTGSIWAYGWILGTGVHKTLPGTQILPNTGTAGRSCPTARTRSWPRRRMTAQDHHDPVPGTWLPDGAGRQALPAVSHADQSWIIASIASRWPTEVRSYSACGAGIHRINRREMAAHPEELAGRRFRRTLTD
jgi:hypothetical protein